MKRPRGEECVRGVHYSERERREWRAREATSSGFIAVHCADEESTNSAIQRSLPNESWLKSGPWTKLSTK